MKVQDVMTAPAHSCAAGASVVTATQLMWDYDCGALPVLDQNGRPVGMITDRDICMAVTRRNRFPANIGSVSNAPGVTAIVDRLRIDPWS